MVILRSLGKQRYVMAEKLVANKDKRPVEAPKTTRLGIWIALIAVLAMVGVGYWGLSVRNAKNPQKTAGTATSTAQTSSVSIGGPFTLTDHNGKVVTEQDFRGKFMLVVFGYSFCPDVCPTQLSTISEVIDALGVEGARVTPIFITVDPERDTPESLKEYVTYFHPSLVALTGTTEQIKAVAKAYRVYYAKANENKDDPEDYLMDHSAITYLMGPDGKFIIHFSYGTDSETMAKRIRGYL